MNIGEYLPDRRRGKYSPIFTEPEANNCFSIISDLKNRENDSNTLIFISGQTFLHPLCGGLAREHT